MVTQPRAAPAPSAPVVNTVRLAPAPSAPVVDTCRLAAGLCDGKLRSKCPAVERKRGGVGGCANERAWSRGRVEIGEKRLFLRGSCRGIMSRVSLHPWAGTFPWQLDSSEEAGFFKATRAPGHLERGWAWPHGHLLPRWAPQHPAPDGTGGAFLGRSSAPHRLPPSCHPRDSGLATFHGSPLSLGHARPRALWSARGLLYIEQSHMMDLAWALE